MPGDAFIPTLAPYGLDRVPGYDPAREAPIGEPGWRADWFAWRNRLIALRAELDLHYERHPGDRSVEMALCAADPARWLALWGWIEEPRPRPGEAAIKPFAPMAFQVDLIQWFVATCELPEEADGYVSKCRGLGASWSLVGTALWGWLFRRWRGAFLSAKQEKVDKPLDLDSLFGKALFLLDYLPPWMLPAGFNRGEAKLRLMLKHPNGYNQITGDSTTDDSLRGGRATYVVCDETAFMPDFVTTWLSLDGATDHRFGVSTESFKISKGWWNTWTSVKQAENGLPPDARRSVKELDWQENPYHDEVWHARKKAKLSLTNPEGFEVEYLRNPYAVAGQWMYPIAETLPDTDEDYDPSLPLVVGVDPGYADPTALVWGNLVWKEGRRGVRWLDSYELHLAPVQWFAHLLTGVEPAPGDEAWALWSELLERYPGRVERVRGILRFFAGLPWKGDLVHVYMDPAGAAKPNGVSFWEMLVDKTAELRQRTPALGLGAEPVVPLYAALSGTRRLYDERQNVTRKGLIASEFAKTQGAQRIRDALRNSRFQEQTERATGEAKPIHGDESHIRSACEYVYTYLDLGLADPIDVTPKRGRPDNPFARRKVA